MTTIFVGIISVYQKIISPLFHQMIGVKTFCRNNPRCSIYAKEILKKHGVAKGLLMAIRRILNCQPFFSL